VEPLFLVKAFSVALVAGSLSFLMSEWRHYRKSFGRACGALGGAPDTGRLLRRTAGSALLLLMSALMFMGRLPEPGQTDPDKVLGLFYYWMSVLGLALVLGVIALVDALTGVKKLGSAISLEQARELSALAEQLREAKTDPSLLDKLIVEDQDLRSDQA
jgi:hypothetical protein